ncbi:hypothetical protein B7463_g2047, partial [Scytalidium lignicola]
MTAKYSAPFVESITEHLERGGKAEAVERNGVSHHHEHSDRNSTSTQVKRSLHEGSMPSARANTGRERSRRSHRSSAPANNKHNVMTRGKVTASSRHMSSLSSEEIVPRRPTTNGHRRHSLNKGAESSSSSSSSSDEDEHVEDHRAVVAITKEKLTSPSLLSTKTNTTDATNVSSGSISTITQEKPTRDLLLRQPEVEEVPQTPISPAVPDAPDVFSYLNDESDQEQDHDHVGDPMAESQWLPPKIEAANSTATHDLDRRSDHAANSSVSSSFHSDTFSDPPAGNETDRSSSPERSVKGHEDNHSSPAAAPKDGVSAKVASQMAAAHKRQKRIRSAQPFMMPELPRGPPAFPPPPPPPQSMALSPRYYQHPQHQSPPRIEQLPVTGYELLASRLSTHGNADKEGRPQIKPMYRKFEALNHRLLLHLQDELGELEEQLHQLDMADTQSRRLGKELIVPASRRAAVQAGGELQWHKSEILGRIGYKMAQYNQALSSFNSTQKLESPEPTDISRYREYLRSEHPIAEVETHFLDPADDLVSMYSEKLISKRHQSNEDDDNKTTTTTKRNTRIFAMNTTSSIALSPADGTLSIFAAAIAGSVLIPILTFPVIPNFLGRLTVVILVASGIVGALYQAGMVNRGCITIDVMTCGAVYSGVMVIIAAIMA